MNYWILTVVDSMGKGGSTAQEIFERRLKDKFWTLDATAHNRNHLEPGDQVIFYVGGQKTLAGTATLSTSCYRLSEDEVRAMSYDGRLEAYEYGLGFGTVQAFSKPVRVDDHIHELKFIKNKAKPYGFFQGSIRKISEEDHKTVLRIANE